MAAPGGAHSEADRLVLEAATGRRYLTPEELKRVDFSLQWDHLMADYLTELDDYYWDDKMSPEEKEHYRELLCTLKDRMPIIERLNLYRPPVLLEV